VAVRKPPTIFCSGDDVHEARANAYAGMHRKEVVRLSKDSLNQLDQSRSIPRRDALNPRDTSPIPASVPGQYVSPNHNASSPGDAFSPELLLDPKSAKTALKNGSSSSNDVAASAANDEAVDTSNNGDDITAASGAAADVIDVSTAPDGRHSTAPSGRHSTAANGGHSNGGYASVDEMKQNGLTMGMSGDLDALFAEAGIASDGSSIGSKQQEDIRRPAEGRQTLICCFLHSCFLSSSFFFFLSFFLSSFFSSFLLPFLH
jgi:hypothetical protein